MSGASRVVVSAGDGSEHVSGDFFSAVLGGLVDPEGAGLSAGAKDAAMLALADSVHATAYHTASRQTLDQVAMKIGDDIKALTGLDLSVVTASGSVVARSGDVVVDLLASSDAGISSQGYELEIADVLTIRANTTSGVFYGSRTVLQMLVLAEEEWVLPRGTVRDYPTQVHRLMHLDMNRKYFEMDYLADLFRQMSWTKVNAFKIHFGDSNGFRLYDPGTAAWTSAVSATPTTGAGTAVSATSSVGAPTSVAVTPGNGSLAVRWSPPTGRVVRSYRVQIRAGSSAEWVSADYRDSAGSGTAYKTVTDRSHTFGSLSNGTAYQVRVSADTGFPGLADARGQYVSGAKKWFYDKADVAMLESWAAENHISIMPGFEFPGHATVINDLYDVGFAYGSNPCGTAHVQAHLKPGFVLDMTSARAIAQAKAILEHFTEWFSGPYVHIGGEEVSHDLPKCPRVTSYITRTSGVSTFGDMMTVFFNDFNTTVRGLEKSMVIYNGLELLSPSASPRLAGSIVVMDYNTNASGYAFFGGLPGSAGTRHQFMKLRPSAGLYLTPNNGHFWYPEEARLYDTWSVEPSTTYLGTGLGIWLDYNHWGHDEYVERLLREPRAILGDRTWNGTTTPDSVTAFYPRLDAIGDPPGFVGYQEPTRVNDGVPSHHYAFDNDGVNIYPPSHYKDTRDGRGLFLKDGIGGLHGTADRGSINTTDKKVGDASFQLNGTDNIGVGLGGVDILAPWTLAVWVKRTGSWSGASLLSSPSDTGQFRYIRLQRILGTQVGIDNYSTGCDFGYSTPVNTWVHLTFVATTTETTLFVNGDRQSTTCFSMPLPMAAIGKRNNGHRVHLDDLKIWDEALSTVQILELLPGLVHWWWFDEGSGSSVGDRGTSPVAGTVTGASWLAAGLVGSALSFDGTDDYVTVGASSLAASGGWTAALWVRRTGGNTSTALFGPSDSSASGAVAIKLEQKGTTNEVGFTRFGTADHSFGYVAPLNSWVYLTFVGDASSTKLYVNGALEDEVAQGIDLPLHYIGVINNTQPGTGRGDYLQADLDEVRVYDRALSATQVGTLSGSQRAVTISATELEVIADTSNTYAVTYTVSLATPPTGSVTVTPTSAATATATVSPASLVFTTVNWATAQTVTVSGVSSGSTTISHAVSGGDYGANNVTADSVEVTFGYPQEVFVSFDLASRSIPEGTSTQVAVLLSELPRRTVAVPITATPANGAGPADYTVSPAVLSFGATEAVKFVTVTAVADDADDNNERVIVGLGSLPEGLLAGSPASASVTIGQPPLTVLVSHGLQTYAVPDGSSLWVGNEIARVTARVVAAQGSVIATFTRPDADLSSAGQQINLYPGSNYSALTVSTDAGATFRSYSFYVNRAAGEAFARDPGRDFDTLDAAGNDNPGGLWSDGTTMWVSDVMDAKIYAYDAVTKQRNASKDFDSVPSVGGLAEATRGLWSDGETMWVADGRNDRLTAISLTTGVEIRSAGFSRLNASGNDSAVDIFSDGETMWVVDSRRRQVFAYNVGDGARVSEREIPNHILAGFDTPAPNFNTGGLYQNVSPRGIWSDGASFWASDDDDNILDAYRKRDLAREEDQNFSGLTDASNTSPHGIWSDHTTMWVIDTTQRKLFAYNMPVASNTQLRTLAINGTEIADFDPETLAYTVLLERPAPLLTLDAEPMHDLAEVISMTPADADPAALGHQIALVPDAQSRITTASAEVTVRNQSGDTSTYTVTARAAPGVLVDVDALTVPVGGAGSYGVSLATRPTASVTVTPTSAATATATVSGALTFTTANWATAQTVTVRGANAGSTSISHSVAGGDYGTNSVTADSVAVTVVARAVAVSATELSVIVGADGSYTVSLATRPTGSVTVTPTSAATATATVSGALTFTTANWATAQTVTVRGAAVGEVVVSHGVSGGGYGSVVAPGVAVTVVVRPVHAWSFDEGSGSSVGDSGTSPVAGTVTGASWLAAGLVGSALSFDGTDDYVTVGASSLAASGGWTAALWVRRTGGNTSTALFGPSDSSASGAVAIKLEQKGTTNEVGFTRFGTADHSFGYVAPLNSWVYLTFVGDASSTKLYVNGALEDEVAQGIDLPLHYIGVINNTQPGTGRGDYLQADLDEVRVYDRALSATQVDALSGSQRAVTMTISTTTLGVLAAATDTYTVSLATPPTGSVTVTPTSAATATATVSPASLVFTTVNWATAQTVTVSGVSSGSTTISHAVSGGDYGANNVTADSVEVTIGEMFVSFDLASRSIPEGTSTQVAVLLSELPRRTVAVPITATPANGAGPADYTVSPAVLSFGATEVVKFVTVTAVADDADDNNERVIVGLGSLPEGLLAGSPASASVTIGQPPLTVLVSHGLQTYAVPDGSSLWVGNEIARVTARVVAAQGSVIATFTRPDADLSSAGQQINLYPGSNYSALTVSTDAGATFRSYSFYVNRAAGEAFARDPGRDFDTLDAAGNDNPGGLWSDGTTMWVSDVMDAKIYAYDAVTKQRNANKDFDSVPSVGGLAEATRGLWSDGETMWVADGRNDRLTAISLTTGVEIRSAGFSRLNASGNDSAVDIFSDGETMWVVDSRRRQVFAYNVGDGARVSEREIPNHILAGFDTPAPNFNTGSLYQNVSPRGIWSDGASFWASDDDDNILDAYRKRDLAREEDQNFSGLTDASNTSPHAIWSDHTTMWVIDTTQRKLFAYNMPVASNTQLRTLAINGTEIADFDPETLAYTVLVERPAPLMTLDAEPMHDLAEVISMTPADADPAALGHQIALVLDAQSGITTASAEVTVRNQSGDTSTYTVAVIEAAPPAPPPDVIPRLREWTGVLGSFYLSGASRVVVSAGDGSKHVSGDFFSAVLGGLVDPDQAGLSAGAKDAATLALADSVHATAYHTASRQTLDQVAMKIGDDIKALTGLDLSVVTASGSVVARSGDVVVDLLASSDAGISSQGYELEIADVLTISANTTSGVFYGSRTVLQMLVLAEEEWVLPRGTARDYPTQVHRLMHLDMNRKYFEMDYLADLFRQMSWTKVNAFKIHFGDSNGFRLYDPGTAAWTGTVSATPTTDAGTAVSATSSAGAPTSVAVTPGNGSLAVRWSPPTGRVVRSYRVQIRAGSSAEWVSADYRDSAGSGTAYKTVTDRSHTFGSLSNGTAYQVRVSADTGFPGLADARGQYVSGAKKWFYDKADVAMLESWAAENHISIMPGFEFPGHATVINDLYDVGFAYGSNPCGTAHVQAHLKPGFVLDMTSARAIAQAKAIMEHFTDWFSGPYVHIGGEEVSHRFAELLLE